MNRPKGFPLLTQCSLSCPLATWQSLPLPSGSCTRLTRSSMGWYGRNIITRSSCRAVTRCLTGRRCVGLSTWVASVLVTSISLGALCSNAGPRFNGPVQKGLGWDPNCYVTRLTWPLPWPPPSLPSGMAISLSSNMTIGARRGPSSC